MFGNVISEIPSREQIHHQVQVLSVLKRVVHVHQEPMYVNNKSSNYGLFIWERSLSSFMTDWTLFLAMTLALDISFMANSSFSFFFSTFQTLPKPPRPIAYWNWKWFLDTTIA